MTFQQRLRVLREMAGTVAAVAALSAMLGSLATFVWVSLFGNFVEYGDPIYLGVNTVNGDPFYVTVDNTNQPTNTAVWAARNKQATSFIEKAQ
ncbi:MAG: hypothetical protein AAFY38_15855 [Pseudomonadota bacterium]